MLGCIQPMSSPMMKRMFGLASAASAELPASNTEASATKTAWLEAEDDLRETSLRQHESPLNESAVAGAVNARCQGGVTTAALRTD